jgi:hypothetical protein
MWTFKGKAHHLLKGESIMKSLVMSVIALLAAPVDAPTLIANPRPQAIKARFVCAALRAPWLTDMTGQHELVADAVMLSDRIGPTLARGHGVD